MGKSSAAVKRFVGKPSIAADLCNGVVFGGREVVKPRDLEPISGESEFLITDKEGKKSVSSDEFLSHFLKEDKLIPIITLVLYYDAKEWDGSLDLHGLLNLGEDKETVETMKKYIPNYNINLVNASTVNEEKFQTELRVMFGAIKRKGNRGEMEKYIQENNYFEKMDEDAYDALGVMLDAKEHFEKMKKKDKGGTVSMCKALQDIFDEGIEKGKITGATEKLKEIAKKKFSKGFSIESIADMLEESVELITKLVNEN